MITNEYGNNVVTTTDTYLFDAARRAVERAYRKPWSVFGEPGYITQIIYAEGGWTISNRYTRARNERFPIGAAYALADMWEEEHFSR